jgi:uncharacterized repeat protein (TIGR03803 family)
MGSTRNALLAFLVINLLLGSAWAQKESTVYSFCAKSGCTDGEYPWAGLVSDKTGNLFGTTSNGGASNYGTVFKITPSGKESVLYSFCKQSGCKDGRNPFAGLVFDHKGNLYGTTLYGGAANYGTVFKVTPSGKETVLYSFCKHSNCADGADPRAVLVFDQLGNLYGTTSIGGAHDNGTVFKLTPSGKESVLYSFCAQVFCPDGASPYAGVVLDTKGNLYGTTYVGGDYVGNCDQMGCGTVFKVTPSCKVSVLHSFCGQGNCDDGATPYAALTFDKKGDLYGTTEYGGLYNLGTVFKITPAGKESVLYSFCKQTDCGDGENPYADVIFDAKGNLYGTTFYGGAYDYHGTVFKLTPSGKESVLYSFCGQSNCTDGEFPSSALVFDQKGTLYGSTTAGGAFVSGIVFTLVP